MPDIDKQTDAQALFDQTPDMSSTFDKQADLTEAPKEKYSKLESAGRGAAQSLTFGLADEMVGAYESPEGALKAMSGILGRDVSDDPAVVAYVKARDKEREKNKEAHKQNPISYTSGEIAGGLGTLAIPGGALAKAGKLRGLIAPATMAESAAVGGLYGAGSSEAELPQGDVGGLAKDVGIGASIGAILPTALSKANESFIQPGMNAVKNIPVAGSIVSATEAGLKGKFMGSEAAKKQYARNLAETTQNEVLNPTADLRSTIGQGIGTIENQAAARGTEVELPELNEAREASENIEPGLATEENASNVLKKQIDRYLKGMENGEQPVYTASRAQKIKKDLQRLNEQLSPEEAGEIKPIVGKAASNVRQSIEGAIPELGEANKAYSNVMDALESLDINPTVLSKMKTEPTAAIDLKTQASNLLSSLEDPKLKGVAVEDKFNNFLDNIKQIPDVGEDLAKQMESKVKNSIKDYSLSKKVGVGGLSEASFLSGSMSWLGNLAGKGVNMATPSGFVENAGSIATKAAGTALLDKKQRDTAKMSSNLYQKPDEYLKNVATQVSAVPELKAVSDSLVDAIDNKNDAGKNAAIFTLMQNPRARAILKNLQE